MRHWFDNAHAQAGFSRSGSCRVGLVALYAGSRRHESAKSRLKDPVVALIGRKRCFTRCQLRFSRIFLAVSRDAACCIEGNFARKLPTAEGWGTSGNFGRKPKNFAAYTVAD